MTGLLHRGYVVAGEVVRVLGYTSRVGATAKELTKSHGVRTIIYPAKDLASAKAPYGTLLGVAPSVDKPYHVGFTVEGQDVGLDPNGHASGMTGPAGYWHVDDIRGRLQALLEAGAEEVQGVRDVGGGKQIAIVRDAGGNAIGLLQNP